MPSNLKFSIAEPCHEDWQKMTATGKGRYCNACTKEVVDFTSMSDTEVLHYFINKKNENICGRMYQDQLNRDMHTFSNHRKKMGGYWNYLIMLFLFLFKGNGSKGQLVEPALQTEQSNGNDRLPQVKGKIAVARDKKFTVSGIITDNRGLPLPGVTVKIKGTNVSTVTDTNGLYKLHAAGTNDVLLVSAVGFMQAEMNVNISGKNNCVLRESVMGELIFTGFVTRSDDDEPLSAPERVAVIEVKDKVNGLPVKATINIKKESGRKPVTANTNKEGIYKLRRITPSDNYLVTLSAAGYRDSIISIKGCNFEKRKEFLYVSLEPLQQLNGPAAERRIVLGGIQRHSSNDPLIVIDGIPSDKKTMDKINPSDIEKITVLKNSSVIAMYGSPATAGVILISTKKKTADVAPALKLPVKEKGGEGGTAAFSVHLKISPNPVKRGSTLTVNFETGRAGNFELRVFNPTGALIQSQQITAGVSKNTGRLNTGAEWSPGVYTVNLVDGENRLAGTGSFIVF